MGTVSVSWPEIHAFRLHRHHLDRPASKVQLVQVVRDACGIQSQFLSAASLALRARVRGLTRDDIERALWRGRTPVKAWAMRGAVHLLPPADFPLYKPGPSA